MSFVIDELRRYIEERVAWHEKRIDSSANYAYNSTVGAISAYNAVLTKLDEMEKRLKADANQG